MNKLITLIALTISPALALADAPKPAPTKDAPKADAPKTDAPKTVDTKGDKGPVDDAKGGKKSKKGQGGTTTPPPK